MKREPYQEYATAAYRLRAQLGSAEEFAETLRIQAMENHGEPGAGKLLGSPTEAAVIRTEKLMEEQRAVLEDLAAADRAMAKIAQRDIGYEMLAALRIVYMEDTDRPMRRGEIQLRVQAAANRLYVDNSTIYRWLRVLRVTFARERGLRVQNFEYPEAA